MERLRQNQSEWRRFRDHPHIDGNDGLPAEPKSTQHYRQRTDRTLARIRYLQALADTGSVGSGDLSGYYSDGIRTFAFQQVLEQGSHPTGIHFFAFSTPDPGWPDNPGMGEAALSGVVIATGKGQWGSNDGPYPKYPAGPEGSEPPAELEIRAHQGVLYVNHSGSGSYIGDYARLRGLTPADTSMLYVLHLCPAELFDNTTEGIGADELEQLTVDGNAGPYRIRSVAAHDLRVDCTGGTLQLRRFPGRDGSAVIAALTTNGRARTLELWKLKSLQNPPAKAELPSLFPEWSWEDYYDRSPSPEESLIAEYGLDEDPAGIIARAIPADPDHAPDHHRILLWDGYGFISRIRHDE